MTLSDALKALEGSGPTTFAQWQAAASPEDLQLVMSYINNPAIQLDPLVKTLRANGVPITRETVAKLRRL